MKKGKIKFLISKEMGMGICFPIVLAVVVIWVFASLFENRPHSYVTVDIANRFGKNNPSVHYTVYDHWNHQGWSDTVHFYDEGFDGSLDEVVFFEGNVQKVVDANSPDWPIWQKRYLDVRTEAAGK